MPITDRVAEWIPEHPATTELGRVSRTEPGDMMGTVSGSPVRAESEVPAAPAVTVELEPLGTAGRLRRIVAALTRQGYEGPRDQRRARANADRLLETIRVLSAL